MRSLLLATLLIAACSSSKPKDVTIDKLGVTLTVPGDWDVKQRDTEVRIGAGGLDGVILRAARTAPTTLETARAELIQGAKMREEKTLPSGGFFFHYDVDYGTPGKPMVLPHIQVVLPTPSGGVTCELQLQPSQDPAPIAKACSSMRVK